MLEVDVREYTLSDTMRILDVSRQTLMKWIRKGKVKVNREDDWKTAPYLIPAEEVARLRQERIVELTASIEKDSESLQRIKSATVSLE